MEWINNGQMTLEEELQLEAVIRYIQQSQDHEEHRALCVQLLRHSWKRDKLMKSAVHHIAKLEADAIAHE